MAAWLAYLKSRLLLPKPAKPSDDEPPAEELAARWPSASPSWTPCAARPRRCTRGRS